MNKDFRADMPRSKGLNLSRKEPQGGDWSGAGRRSGSGRSKISMVRMSEFRARWPSGLHYPQWLFNVAMV